MAEAALFSVASKLLSTVASPAFGKAYEKACSVWNARAELEKLKSTIGTIQAVLRDAERKQNDSAAVKDWIKRVKDVLYDADDLFDEVATDELLRQQIKGSKVLKKVRASCSRLNPIVSNNSIAKKVKAIRKNLLEISEDMKVFNFAVSLDEKPISSLGGGRDPGSFVDSKSVIGRDEDKKAILELLLHDQSNDDQKDVQVIAIVGIGGMGKTTLTQLVYQHEDVQKNFENRWFACISDTSDDKEILGKIFQSMHGTSYGDSTLHNLQTGIKESIEGKKFLLVLDDVWDEDLVRWQKRMSLLGNGAKGSRIIVSTRSLLVAKVVGALRTHELCGLSKEASWDLFKSVVNFTPEQERDATWTELGREIVKKCANVPLAINSIASLLFEKNTIQEWESIRDEELPELVGQSQKDGIMSVLKLSYEHLRSDLKPCFAYCFLFPKGRKFEKMELINLWIAQGYIGEDVGDSPFMHLFRRSFFMKDSTWKTTEYYKMHDLIHDLAKHVAGEESVMLTTSSDKINGARHVTVGYGVDKSLVFLEPLQSVNRLRSLLFPTDRCATLVIGNQLANMKSLRALRLKELGIENVPSCIGELKHLRYLDISENKFKELPDFRRLINLRHLHIRGCSNLEHMPPGLEELVNLCTLDISQCGQLKVWPDNFRRLINLRHLHNDRCYGLKHMPAGFEELTCLQQLDVFSVGKGMGGAQRSKLDVLSKLKLRGELKIEFSGDTDDWDGVECWQPPLTLQELEILYYGGMRIPNWGNGRAANPSLLPKLTSLHLFCFTRVKCLPPFTHIPNMKILHLDYMAELEYIEDEEEAGSDALFILPHLERLVLRNMPKLKGWWRNHSSSTCTSPQLLSFTSLFDLNIDGCPELNSMPLCPRLQSLSLRDVNAKKIQQFQLLPIGDTSTSSSSSSSSSSCLERVYIHTCDGLSSFPGESLMSLSDLSFFNCIDLKKVDLPPFHLNNLERLRLERCPELELWEEEKRGVDWVSLPKLRIIQLDYDAVPSSQRLPDCLRRRQERGELKITSIMGI